MSWEGTQNFTEAINVIKILVLKVWRQPQTRLNFSGAFLFSSFFFFFFLLKTNEFAKYFRILIGLRVQAFFHRTVRVCHVYCNFKIGFTCRITVIFGTLKDGSLLINNLASNICFSYRNMFQNGVNALPKIVDAFLSKSSKFHLVRIIR